MGQQNSFPNDPRQRCAACGNMLSLCACRGSKSANQNRSTPSTDFSATVVSAHSPTCLIPPENFQNYSPGDEGMPLGNRVSGVGSIISERYELLAKLGSGGMGVVYKARHLALNKLFAIKVVSDHLASQDEFRLRFDREAKSASMLDHANLVSITDYGMTEFDEPYIVMDFINGRNLAEELAHYQRLSIERAVRIFMEICDGVGYAHQIGLIHRDLKPGNIMLIRAGELNEQVKIIDFGIAKLLSGQGDVTQSHTRTNAVGSPLYMSPEQCSGQKADQRSDIYSMGCLMYECLSSRPPFQGDSVLVTMSMHMNQAPEPLERFQIPHDLGAVVMRCLAKRPSERFQSMEHLKVALAHCQTEGAFAHSAHDRGGSSQSQRLDVTANGAARGPAFSNALDLERNSKSRQIPRPTLAVIVIAGLVFLGITVVAAGTLMNIFNHPQNSTSSQRVSDIKSDAPHENAPSYQTSTDKADATAAQTPKLSEEQKQKLSQEQFVILGPTPQIKDVGPKQTYSNLVQTSDKLLASRQEKEALAYFKLAVSRSPSRSDAYDTLLHYFWKRQEQDKQALQKCVNVATAYLIYCPYDYDFSLNRGQYYTSLRDYPAALADYNRALSSAITANQKSLVHLKRAFVYVQMHDVDHAIADYKKNANVSDPNSLCLFADCYAAKRDFENAKIIATQALEINRKGTQNSDQLRSPLYWARTIRGGANRELGDFAQAKQDYEAALKLAFTPEQKQACINDIKDCSQRVGRSTSGKSI